MNTRKYRSRVLSMLVSAVEDYKFDIANYLNITGLENSRDSVFKITISLKFQDLKVVYSELNALFSDNEWDDGLQIGYDQSVKDMCLAKGLVYSDFFV